tara:strand:- start:354 stop:665 length:312 start_codon:yes stop_codon:yes gene_type:complete
MDMETAYAKLNKSQLIDAYRIWLEENKRFSKNKRKEGKYPHPIINGEKYSWRQFERLPRDAILVFIFTEGCDIKYLSKLEQLQFFVEKREWHPNFGKGIGEEE